MKKFYAVTAALWLAVSTNSHADQTNALVLSDVIQSALKVNPEITAARKRWEAAKKRIAQQYTPANPQISFERMYGPQDQNVISGAEERNILISQELPF